MISIYVSHSSLKFEKGSGSDSDSWSSNGCLLDSADRNGSLKQIRTNSSSGLIIKRVWTFRMN
jgi:hypothetical protein